MIPKFIELIREDRETKFVNVNTIISVEKYSYIKNSNDSLIRLVGGDCFRDYRSDKEIINLINGTEALPTKTTLTFPRKMLVHNGDKNSIPKPYIVIADLGDDFVFRYVCVAWGTEDYFEDGSGCFETSMYKFAEDIGEL